MNTRSFYMEIEIVINTYSSFYYHTKVLFKYKGTTKYYLVF